MPTTDDESRAIIHAEGERLFDDALEAGRAIGRYLVVADAHGEARILRGPHYDLPSMTTDPHIAWAQSRIDDSIQRKDQKRDPVNTASTQIHQLIDQLRRDVTNLKGRVGDIEADLYEEDEPENESTKMKCPTRWTLSNPQRHRTSMTDDDDYIDDSQYDALELVLLERRLDAHQRRLDAAFDEDWLRFMWFDTE